jgi:hypothetical protein
VNKRNLYPILFIFFFCACENPPQQSPTAPEAKIEIKKKEISYFNDSIDSTFELEPLDTSVAVIEKLYFDMQFLMTIASHVCNDSLAYVIKVLSL